MTHPSIRRLNTLSPDNIEKIVKAYLKFSEVSGFSRAVDVKEVAKNDYNLNVSLYVMPIEEAEQVKISQVYSDLRKIEQERSKVNKELEQVLTEIAELE